MCLAKLRYRLGFHCQLHEPVFANSASHLVARRAVGTAIWLLLCYEALIRGTMNMTWQCCKKRMSVKATKLIEYICIAECRLLYLSKLYLTFQSKYCLTCLQGLLIYN